MGQLFHTQMRMQLDFSITIKDDAMKLTADNSTHAIEAIMREKRLLAALLNYEGEIFTNFLKKNILTELETIDSAELEVKVFGQRLNEETLLEPVIKSMDGDDASFFAHAMTQGIFAVQTERFSQSIEIHLHDITFV
jgi:hypothetical protein